MLGRPLALLVAFCVALTGSAVAAPPERDVVKADAVFEKGAAAAAVRNYEDAARAFEQAFTLDGRREALFAWAQVERLRGSCDKAIELYRRFLKSPELKPTEVEAAELGISRCERGEGVPKPAVVAPPAPPPPAPKPIIITAPAPPPPSRTMPLAFAGGALVALATAGALYVSSVRDENDAPDQPTLDEYLDVADRARTKRRVSAGLAAAGTLLTGAAVVSWFFPGREDRGVRAWVAPHAGGVAVGGKL